MKKVRAGRPRDLNRANQAARHADDRMIYQLIGPGNQWFDFQDRRNVLDHPCNLLPHRRRYGLKIFGFDN